MTGSQPNPSPRVRIEALTGAHIPLNTAAAVLEVEDRNVNPGTSGFEIRRRGQMRRTVLTFDRVICLLYTSDAADE